MPGLIFVPLIFVFWFIFKIHLEISNGSENSKNYLIITSGVFYVFFFIYIQTAKMICLIKRGPISPI